MASRCHRRTPGRIKVEPGPYPEHGAAHNSTPVHGARWDALSPTTGTTQKGRPRPHDRKLFPRNHNSTHHATIRDRSRAQRGPAPADSWIPRHKRSEAPPRCTGVEAIRIKPPANLGDAELTKQSLPKQRWQPTARSAPTARDHQRQYHVNSAATAALGPIDLVAHDEYLIRLATNNHGLPAGRRGKKRLERSLRPWLQHPRYAFRHLMRQAERGAGESPNSTGRFKRDRGHRPPWPALRRPLRHD